MARTFLLGIAISLLLIVPDRSFALRCGSDLVETGDLKIEVLLACGEPLSREVIGYIDQARHFEPESATVRKTRTDGTMTTERIRVMVIEEWIVKDSGNYYSLVFEGNTLKTIEWANKD